MEHFSSRLKSARLRKGWSVQELADAIQLSKQAVSKYELGQSIPDMQRLLQLCDALDVRPDYFNRSELHNLSRVEFRKLVRFPEKEKQKVLEATRDKLECYLELEDIIGNQKPFMNPLQNLEISTFEEAEQAAEIVRMEWNLGVEPLSNLSELIESHHIKVIEVKAGDSFSGLSAFVGDIPLIVLNEFNDDILDRKRFTAAHELGHLLMSIIIDDDKVKEKLCHRFAGAFLFPKNAVYKAFGIRRSKLLYPEIGALKQQYGISMSAIVMRAHALGIVSDSFYKSFMFLWSKWGNKKKEPDTYNYKGSEKSNRFEQLLFKALAEELISQSKAAGLMNLKLAEFLDRYEKYV